MMIYLAVALAVAVVVALAASRRQRPWAELDSAGRARRAAVIGLLAVMAVAGLAASGFEFRRYLAGEEAMAAYLTRALAAWLA